MYKIMCSTPCGQWSTSVWSSVLPSPLGVNTRPTVQLRTLLSGLGARAEFFRKDDFFFFFTFIPDCHRSGLMRSRCGARNRTGRGKGKPRRCKRTEAIRTQTSGKWAMEPDLISVVMNHSLSGDLFIVHFHCSTHTNLLVFWNLTS